MSTSTPPLTATPPSLAVLATMFSLLSCAPSPTPAVELPKGHPTLPGGLAVQRATLSTADWDGDGHAAPGDCDDTNPETWRGPDVYAGDLGSDFQSFCEGYCSRAIAGDLLLSDATEPEVQSLTCLSSVGGSVFLVDNTQLRSLAGLDQLATIAGALYIWGTEGLSDVRGLDGLESVGQVLYVRENQALRSLSGLESLSSVGTDVDVFSNPALVSLAGLAGLDAIPGDLQLQQNGSLESLAGLGNVTLVGGRVLAWDNAALASLDGLDRLGAIGDILVLRGNPSLAEIGALGALRSVGADVDIYDNAALCEADADEVVDGLTHLGGAATVEDNTGSCGFGLPGHR